MCDVCGEPTAAPMIRFGWGSHSYETDLCDDHAMTLTSVMDKAVEKARRVGSLPRVPVAPLRRPRRSRVDTAAVRSWAKKNGIEVSDKGRVSNSVIEQYLQATRSS